MGARKLDIAGDIKFWKDTVVQRAAESCLITTRARIPGTSTAPVPRSTRLSVAMAAC
jgi:hypothetical protein